MVAAVIGSACALVAAGAAFGGHLLDPVSASGAVTPFGGPVAVHVAHVGRIDVDLEAGAGHALRRVTCASAAGRATACYVGG
jgi:hypothetical protein